jgi:prevent-host-death family protein
MAKYHINEAKTHLSILISAAGKGEEVMITRHGKPVARLSGIQKPKKRTLGFHPIDFQSDLLDPTNPAIVSGCYQ